MDPYGGFGYVVDAGGYADAGYGLVDPGFGGGYGPEIVEYGGGYGYGGVQEVPYIVEEEVYAPAYLEPVGIEHQTYLEPFYGGDPYGYAPSPYIDGLVDLGYNGPWPQDYYGMGGCPPPRGGGCRKRGCERRCKCKDDSDSDSSDDEHHHVHKHIHKHCGGRRSCGGGGGGCGGGHRPMMQNNGITKDDIQGLLDKFESAMNLKYKKAQITELEAEQHVLKTLAKEKRDIQKHVAQAKRDLLLKEALDFNRQAPVPGRRQGSGQQVVSIDFGNQGPQPPSCPPGTRPVMAPPPRPYAPPQPSIIYH